MDIKMNKGETYYKPGQASEGFGELSRVATGYSGEGE